MDQNQTPTRSKRPWVIITLICAIILIAVLAIYYWSKNQEDSGDKNITVSPSMGLKGVIVSSQNMQGMSNSTYVYDNDTFINTNNLSFDEKVSPCKEGTLVPGTFNRLVEDIKKTGFFEAEQPKSDISLVCEGGSQILVRSASENKALSNACSSKETVNKTFNEISSSVNNLLKTAIEQNQKICQNGFYIKTSISKTTCQALLKDNPNNPPYDKVSFGELDQDLQKSFNYAEALVNIGDKKNDYHRKYYEIDNQCYFVFESEFNGKEFEDLN